MKNIKFRYVYKNKTTNEIILKYWVLTDIEENGLPVYYNQYDFISRDLLIFKKDNFELYENDKVEVEEGYSGDHYYKKVIAIIKYDQPDFYLYNINDKDGVVWQDYSWEKLKLIGNIYENL